MEEENSLQVSEYLHTIILQVHKAHRNPNGKQTNSALISTGSLLCQDKQLFSPAIPVGSE